MCLFLQTRQRKYTDANIVKRNTEDTEISKSHKNINKIAGSFLNRRKAAGFPISQKTLRAALFWKMGIENAKNRKIYAEKAGHLTAENILFMLCKSLML